MPDFFDMDAGRRERLGAEFERTSKALANADAAGDADAARQLANHARELQYSIGRMDEATAQRDAQAASARAGFGGAIKYGPRRAIMDNAAQLLAAGKEVFGDEGAVARQVADMNSRRFAETGMDPDAEAGADVGETALLMAPGGAALRGLKVLPKLPELTKLLPTIGRVVRQGAIGGGAAMGASETAETAGDVGRERAKGAAVAVGLPLIVTGAVSFLPSFRNVMARMAMNTTQNTAHMDEVKNMLAGQKSSLPLSMQTGNATAKSLERQVQKTVAQNYYNKIFGEFAEGFQNTVNEFDKLHTAVPGGKRAVYLSDQGKKVTQAWQAQGRKLQQAASSLYGQQLSEAVAKAARDPAKFPVSFANAAEVAQKWASQDGEVWWRKIAPGAERPAGALAKMDEYFTSIKDMGLTRSLDVPELIQLRSNLNAMDKEYYAAQRAAGKTPDLALANRHRSLAEMIGAVDKDIDTFIAANPADRPAVQALMDLKNANEGYADFKRIRNEAEQTATAQLLGHYTPDDPRGALYDLAGRDPAEQRVLVNTLRDMDPAALDDLRHAFVTDMYEVLTSGVGRTASRGKVDPAALGKILSTKYGVIGSELFSAPQYARLKKAMSSIRVLTGSAEGQVDPNTAVSIESTVMAAATRAAAFVARAIYRSKGGDVYEKLLFSDEGLRSLSVLEDVYRGGGFLSKNNKLFNEVGVALGRLPAIAAAGEESDLDEAGRQ